MTASSFSKGSPSGTESESGAGLEAGAGEAASPSGVLRASTTTKRSGLPITVLAMSNNSNVRHELRMVFASAVKLASSG